MLLLIYKFLATQNVVCGPKRWISSVLVQDAQSQATFQPYWARICILTRSLDDSQVWEALQSWHPGLLLGWCLELWFMVVTIFVKFLLVGLLCFAQSLGVLCSSISVKSASTGGKCLTAWLFYHSVCSSGTSPVSAIGTLRSLTHYLSAQFLWLWKG